MNLLSDCHSVRCENFGGIRKYVVCCRNYGRNCWRRNEYTSIFASNSYTNRSQLQTATCSLRFNNESNDRPIVGFIQIWLEVLLAAQNAQMNQSFALFETAEFLLPWHSPRLRALFPLRTTGVHSFTARVRPFCSLFPNKNNVSVRHVSYCKRTNSAARPYYLARPNPFLWKELTVVVV